MNILELTPTGIVIDVNGKTLHGNIANNDCIQFIKLILNIDPTIYEHIYRINDTWAGAYLFLSENNYRYVICGSGRPIIADRIGEIKY